MPSICLRTKPDDECHPAPARYIGCLRSKLGPEAGSAKLVIEDGIVYCTYSDPVGEEYALACRDHGPTTWKDVKRSDLADHFEALELVAGWRS